MMPTTAKQVRARKTRDEVLLFEESHGLGNEEKEEQSSSRILKEIRSFKLRAMCQQSISRRCAKSLKAVHKKWM